MNEDIPCADCGHPRSVHAPSDYTTIYCDYDECSCRRYCPSASREELQLQLAAERAKVAQLEKQICEKHRGLDHPRCAVCHWNLALDQLKELQEAVAPGRVNKGNDYYIRVATKRRNMEIGAGGVIMPKSADALADIRRDVARECAEHLHKFGWNAAEYSLRAKFGLTQ